MPQLHQMVCECGELIEFDDSQLGQCVNCSSCGSSVEFSQDKVETHIASQEQGQTETPVLDDGVPIDWQIGDVFLDLYEVTGLLGQGGMGKVYKVHHRKWDLDLAVKSPRADLLSRGRGMGHFTRECEMWVNLGLHPHIVTCYYVRQLGGIPRVFAEFVSGGSLRDFIRGKELYKGGPEKAFERLLTIAIQMAWGLHHAHEQDLFHLDVKPANVMLTWDDSGIPSAKVTDFGLAKARAIVEEEAKTESDSTPFSQGGMTPAYCAPEQALGRAVSPATDVWSWGLTILEGFVGKVAWKNGPQAPEALERLLETGPRHNHLPQLNPGLTQLLEWCFQDDPKARPQDMPTVVAAAKEVYRELTGSDFSIPAPRSVEGRAESLNNRSASLLDLGKQEEAEDLLAEVLKASPHHPESTFNHAVLRWRKGKMTDVAVLQRMKDVVATHPGDSLPVYLTAQVHLERGDCASATRVLERIEEPNRTRDIRTALEHAQAGHEDSRRLLWSLQGHGDSVRSLSVSRTSKYVLSGSDDNTLKLWDLGTGQSVRTMAGHSGSVGCVSLAAGAQIAVSGSADRTIRVWNLADAKCRSVLEGHTGPVRAVELSRDMKHIISGSEDGKVTVWSVENEACLHDSQGHQRRVNAVAFDREGALALSAGDDGKICIWEAKSGACVRTIDAHEGSVNDAWLSPCGRYAMSAGSDNLVKLWQVETGVCTRKLAGHTAAVNGAVLSRDGRYAVSGSRDGTVRLWQAGVGRCLRTFEGHSGTVYDVSITRDMELAISAGRDGTVKVWSLVPHPVPAPSALCRALRSESALTTEALFRKAVGASLAALERQDILAAAKSVREARSQPGFVRHADAVEVWTRLYVKLPRKALSGGWEGPRLKGHTGPVVSVCISLDGRYAMSGSEDATLRLWDLKTGQCLRALAGHGKTVTAVCLSRDARQAISGSADATLNVWDVAAGKCLATFEGGGGPVAALCLSPDFRYALSGGWDIRVWDVKHGRCLRAVEGHSSDVISVDWSPDGRFALSGSSEDVIKLWDVATGECVEKFGSHTGTVESVRFSPDMRYALSGNGNMWGKPGEAQLWELTSGKCLRTFKGHKRSVHSVCFSADSRFAFTGGADGEFKVWDLHSGKCVRTFKGHDDGVRAVAVSYSGQHAITAGQDGELQVLALDWDLEDKHPAEWDEGARPYVDTWLTLQTPPVHELVKDEAPTPDDVVRALSRKGKPAWTDRAFSQLMFSLGCAGYGWLTTEGVHQELDRMPGKRGGLLSGLLGRKK